MSSYLRDLVARTIGAASVVQPRLSPAIIGGAGDVDDLSGSPSTYGQTSGTSTGRSERQPSVQVPDALEQRLTPVVTRERRGDVVSAFQGGDLSSLRGAPQSSRARAHGLPEAGALPGLAPEAGDGSARAQTQIRKDEARGEPGAARMDGTPAHSGSGPFKEIHVEAPAAADTSPVVAREKKIRSSSARERADALEDVGRTMAAAREFDQTLAHRRSTPEWAAEVRESTPQPAPRQAEPTADSRTINAPARVRAAQREPATSERTLRGEDTVINVTIGRIEVRAPAAPPSKSVANGMRQAPSSRSELDAYLRGRSEARR